MVEEKSGVGGGLSRMEVSGKAALGGGWEWQQQVALSVEMPRSMGSLKQNEYLVNHKNSHCPRGWNHAIA